MITQFSHPNYHPTTWQLIEKPRHAEKFGVIKLDYDMVWEGGKTHVSRPTRNGMTHDTSQPVPRGVARRDGLPATAPFMVYEPDVIMTSQIQYWIHLLCWGRSGQSEADAKNSWRQLMADDKFTTNKAGSTTHADFINRTNLDKDPMRLMRLATGGAVLKITGSKNIYGVECLEFSAIDAAGDFRQYTPDKFPWLFYQPTNSVREEILNERGVWNGSFCENISDPFPQYNGRAILPIMSVGYPFGYIAKDRVRILADDEAFPSPFVK